MKLFRKKDEVVVERRQRFSSLVPTWFRSQERCDSDNRSKPDINAADVDGMTRLHVASMKGCSMTVQKLLQEGADVNSRNSIRVAEAGYTPLHYAVRDGSTEIVKLLLKNNACVDSESDCGKTPLHVAAERGNIPIAEALLNHGASIYSMCSCPESADCAIPLHFALRGRHLGMVKLLLISGASRAGDEAQNNKHSETTFRLACRSKDHTIIAYVFMCHIDLSNKKSNKMAFFEAVNASEVEYTRLARHLSQWIFSKFKSIDSALLLPALMHSAVEIGSLKIVKDFLKWTSDVRTLHHPLHERASDATFGRSLLHTATKHWQLDIAKLLITNGADVNFQDGEGRTPIFFAIECLDVQMTKLLLSNGASIETEK